ncbi:MAG: extracellular solute-binding protein [Spirochaetaceae bacterium]|jgi:spermidine/putrescine transport system substrate-binding protein|nr:extracellular solute-binding protein [Spirochaetaceae bacterium]
MVKYLLRAGKFTVRMMVFAVFAAIVFGGCSPKKAPSASTGNKLYIYNWTYYCPDSVLDKFRMEYNVELIYDQYASNEDMYAKIQAGGSGYDIVFPSADFMEIMTKQGMFAKIDHSKLSNLKNIDINIVNQALWDPDMEYFVPYYYGAATISVNTKRVSKFDDSWKKWNIFERAEYQGKMTMLDDSRQVLGGALMSLGYSPNETDAEKINKARDLVEGKWKPNLTRFDSEAFGKGYANEDFWIVHAFFEGIREEIGDNAELLENTVVFLPEEGGPAYLDGMCILKDAKHIDLAHEFINFIHRPEIYAEFCDYFGFPATVNIPARSLQKEEPFLPAEELVAKSKLYFDVGEAIDVYNAAWFDTIRR